jgi:predicted aspartyl protease
MKRNIYLLILLVTQFLAANYHLNAETTPGTIRFRTRANSMIVVPVRLNDRETVEFLVDTGATTTALTTETAVRLKLEASAHAEVDTPTGTITIPQGSLSRITMGERTVTNLKVYWTDLPLVMSIDRKLGGILGLNFLRQFNFAIDFGSKKITLTDFAADEPSGERIPMQVEHGRMLVSASVDGTDIKLALDSGASNVFLYSSGCRKLQARINLADSEWRVVSAGGGASLKSTNLNDLRLGNMSLGRLTIGLLESVERPADGLLPLHLFRRIYVNTSKGYVIVDHTNV